MALWVIELNDVALKLWRDGELLESSPGVAIIDRNEVVTGNEAAARQHLNPRAVYNRYWQYLNETPLPGGSRRCRHHADLAFHHLRAVMARHGNPAEAIFAVPGHYRAAELALLLGICGALKLAVGGLVDSGVAALAGCAAAGRWALAELHLHHATVNELDVDAAVMRHAVRQLDQPGLQRIHVACIDLIADAFLEQSRFDPLHEAATEQLLHANLPAWLGQCALRGELDLAIDYRGARFGARIPTREFERVVAMVLAPLAERIPRERTLVLSPALAALPGSTALLAPAQLLDENAVAVGIAEHRLALGTNAGASVAFTTRLPATAKPTLTAPATAASTGSATQAVTHILAGGRARALAAGVLLLGADGTLARGRPGAHDATVVAEHGQAMLHPAALRVSVNGVELAGPARLRPGDRITLGDDGVVFVAIDVQDDRAP